MSVHLNEYEVLIQLLIGSVVIAFLFQSKDFLSKMRDNVSNSVSITGYELSTPEVWNQKLNIFRKFLMIILAVYGCMILYCCANLESTTTLSNGENLLIEYLFGIAVLSCIVSIYQIITFIRPASRMYLKSNSVLPKHLIFYFILIGMAFIIFILKNPNDQVDNYNFSHYFETKIWEIVEKINWENHINSWVIINLLLWIAIYWRIYRRVKVLTYKLTTDDNIIKHLGVEERLKYILNEKLKYERECFKKRHLKKRAKQELRKEDNYFNSEEIIKYKYIEEEKNKDTILHSETVGKKEDDNNKLTESLINIINSSNLSNLRKKQLIKSINRKPIINIQTIIIIDKNEKEKVILEKYANRLCRFGLLEKTVSKGKKVTLVGFGTFEPRKRAARNGRNPQTGKAIKIPAKTVPVFSAGKKFKDVVNGK